MHAASAPFAHARPLQRPSLLAAPDWVTRFTGIESPTPADDQIGIKRGASSSDRFCRVVIQLENALELDAATLEQRTRRAYAAVFKSMGHDFSPVRFWNFLPRIDQLLDQAQSRYMIFNSGRYRAFEDQYGSADRFDQSLATASAVGHSGSDLWIHCLAASQPAVHLGNPRQVSPHRYSERFGKRPPCFARATFLTESKLLLIGGTASIRGEDSLHDNVAAQMRETLTNLSQLIAYGAEQCDWQRPADPLGCIADLRVYHPRRKDAHRLEKALCQRMPGIEYLSLEQADLCRPELLVEIEGVARTIASPMKNVTGPSVPTD